MNLLSRRLESPVLCIVAQRFFGRAISCCPFRFDEKRIRVQFVPFNQADSAKTRMDVAKLVRPNSRKDHSSNRRITTSLQALELYLFPFRRMWLFERALLY